MDSTATTSTYDLAGRLTAVATSDSTGKTTATASYGYDPVGNKTSATNAAGTTNGLSVEELSEAITHLAFYAGWPNAMTAITRLKEIADEPSAA
ncbi:carboxymuconolactone decarboxylase family protein [Streptoverticillium reticulum]|uniref:carboxymuconolactone decarboxylase family protein n=1 Tax=Streptoverticillium reticulum TaxID=1433415 RepID=UPI0039BF028A